MIRTLSVEAFTALGGPDLVYVRPIRAADILEEVPENRRIGASVPPDRILYALHSADGARLAVLTDRAAAYAAARAHELAPVAVH